MPFSSRIKIRSALSPYMAMLAMMAVLLAVGLVVLPHYGEGVDEWWNMTYAKAFLDQYIRGNLLTTPKINYYNGPFYLMLWVAGSELVHWLHPAWMLVDGRHLVNLVTFLAGLWIFYLICRRFMGEWVAVLTVALFATQPLVLGFGFMNQKDMPLMVFFMASIQVGLVAVDRLSENGRPRESEDQGQRGLMRDLRSDWRRLGRWWRVGLIVVSALGGLVLLDVWLLGWVTKLGEGVVRAAYGGQAGGLIDGLFRRVATDAYKTPVAEYVDKFRTAFLWLRYGVTVAVLGVWIGVVRLGLPEVRRRLVSPWLRRYGPLVAAGMLVGMTTSIRLAGPLAGVVVSMILLWRWGRRGLALLGVYWMVAAVTTYLTWPILWGDPVGALVGHVSSTADFTSFSVLYRGRLYDNRYLPWSYLPTLLGLQLTVPALGAGLVGLVVGWRRIQGRKRLELMVMASLWAAIPAFAVMGGWLPIYNNFRHVLFILPALFIFAGLGLDAILRLRYWRGLKAALALGVLVPGVAGILALHPYEYIYFNQLAGGINGAAGQFELDYWCTSFRQTMAYVDQVAPQGAKIAVADALTTAQPFARPDLNVVTDRSGKSKADFAMSCSLSIGKANFYPDYPTVYEVRRGSAVLAVVKARPER